MRGRLALSNAPIGHCEITLSRLQAGAKSGLGAHGSRKKRRADVPSMLCVLLSLSLSQAHARTMAIDSKELLHGEPLLLLHEIISTLVFFMKSLSGLLQARRTRTSTST